MTTTTMVMSKNAAAHESLLFSLVFNAMMMLPCLLASLNHHCYTSSSRARGKKQKMIFVARHSVVKCDDSFFFCARYRIMSHLVF